MAARFINSVCVLLKDCCEDKFIAAAEELVPTEGVLDSYRAKTGDRLFALLVFGRLRKARFRQASDD